MLDPEGAERWRIEGYLPKREFQAQLELALARIDAMRKHWIEAGERYARIAESFAGTTAEPEAIYWRGIAKYQTTRDHDALAGITTELTERFPGNVWTIKASVWGH
jgi:outer membrane protein assembly factor BamD (BamD/ComL family)